MHFKSYLLFLILNFFLTILTLSVCAQAPLQIPYQGIARDAQGAVLQNQNITLLLAIEDISGTELFSETHNTTTNQFGLFNVKIGSISAMPSNLWSNGNRFLHVKIDPAGGNSYTDLGSTQFLSVPYALYAETSNTPGPAGPQGIQGIQGIQGEIGPQGANGSISNGSAAGNTPYWDGTEWVVNNSNIFNNGNGIGIGTTAPNASAKVEISSTTQGFLPPRMTTNQRDSITSPAIGLTIYNITANCLQWWTGSIWFDGCGNNTPGDPLFSVISVFCASGATAVIDVTNPVTGKIWMDRNLGASQVATSSNDPNAYGDLYQWGRRSDGHQCRNSSTTNTLSSTDEPVHSNFIIAPYLPYDWQITPNNNLWQSMNGLNNPCPLGYRIPTEMELEAERLSWVSTNIAGAFASPLKFTLTGMRNQIGGLQYVGSTGHYWSSGIAGTNPRGLLCFSSGANWNDLDKAYGLAIRCIKN